jgi:antitoxin MazE
MDTKLRRWGNSQGIIIPKTILAKMDIDDPEGQPLLLSVKDGTLFIKKKENVSRLEQMFRGFDVDAYYEKYGVQDSDPFGSPVGDEQI